MWSDWRRKWRPTPVFLPGKFHGRRSLVGYSPWGHKESDMTEWFHFTSLHVFWMGLPRWLSGKEFTFQCRRGRKCGFDPWVGKITWRRQWQPTPVFLPGESHGQRKPNGLQSVGSQRVRHDWATECACASIPTKNDLMETVSVRKAVLYGTEHQRIDAFELWCWRRLLTVPWTARRSNQSILKEISPE